MFNRTVQAMGNLFSTPAANSMYRRAGMVGNRTSAPFPADLEAITRTGKRRVGLAAGLGGLGAMSSNRGRSSGSRGLQTRSSAPTPMPPF